MQKARTMGRIKRALSDIERSYTSPKLATAQPSMDTLLSHGPTNLVRRGDLTSALAILSNDRYLRMRRARKSRHTDASGAAQVEMLRKLASRGVHVSTRKKLVEERKIA